MAERQVYEEECCYAFLDRIKKEAISRRPSFYEDAPGPGQSNCASSAVDVTFRLKACRAGIRVEQSNTVSPAAWRAALFPIGFAGEL